MRNFVKWDAQPASVPAAQEALLRAVQIATTAPQGPVYVCFDAAMQEARLAQMPALPHPARYQAPLPARPSDAAIAQAAQWLPDASRPVLLMGRVSRDVQGWAERVKLAETLQAEVLTDLKVGATFPTEHPLHAAPCGMFLMSIGSALALQGTDRLPVAVLGDGDDRHSADIGLFCRPGQYDAADASLFHAAGDCSRH